MHFPKQHAEDIDETCIEKLPLDEIKAGIKLAESIKAEGKLIGKKARKQRSLRCDETGKYLNTLHIAHSTLSAYITITFHLRAYI